MGFKQGLYIMLLAPMVTVAMPIKSEMLKSRAYFTETDNNLLESLDLKSKTMKFTKSDFELCGTNLVRKAQTLSYSCTLPIPSKARISKLQNLVTANHQSVDFGGSKRDVLVEITPDAKLLTLSTSFDHTGIDFEVSKFNDDFFAVYAKVAHLVISDALRRQPIRFEVLESR